MVLKANIVIMYPNIYRNARFILNKSLFRHISRTLEPPVTDNMYDSIFIKSIYGIIKLLDIHVFRDKIYTHNISKSEMMPLSITYVI